MSLLTNEAASQSVTAPELMITIALFAVVYLLLLVAWVRLIGKAVKEGPVLESEKAAVAGSDTAASAASFAVGSDASADEKKKEA